MVSSHWLPNIVVIQRKVLGKARIFKHGENFRKFHVVWICFPFDGLDEITPFFFTVWRIYCRRAQQGRNSWSNKSLIIVLLSFYWWVWYLYILDNCLPYKIVDFVFNTPCYILNRKTKTWKNNVELEKVQWARNKIWTTEWFWDQAQMKRFAPLVFLWLLLNIEESMVKKVGSYEKI